MIEQLPFQIPLGGKIYFIGSLPSGARSPSTWFVKTTRRRDIYFASTQMSGTIKTSLHISGHWQTSFVSEQSTVDLQVHGLESRHLDRWEPPVEFHEGMRLGFTLVIPWTQLLPFSEPVPTPSCGLMMEEHTALHVHLVLMRPTARPKPFHVPNSAVFANMDLGDDHELVLISRKVEWTEADEVQLLSQIEEARGSPNTFVDDRQARDLGVSVAHFTRTTMFRPGLAGERFVLDAYDPRPLSGHE